MSSIPIEIAEVVIDFLTDSKHDLQSCTLVCRAWLARSRALLFRSISIGQTTSESFRETLQQVQSSLLFALFLKHITIDCAYMHKPTSIVFDGLKLETLSRLQLSRIDLRPFYPRVSLTCTASLQALILQKVVFQSLTQFLHLFSAPCFSNLKSLSLTECEYHALLRDKAEGKEEITGAVDPWMAGRRTGLPLAKIMLEEIELGNISRELWSVMYHPGSPFDWTYLRRMSFLRMSNQLICELMDGSFPQLASLEFVSGAQSFYFPIRLPVGPATIQNGNLNTRLFAQLTEISVRIDPASNNDILFLQALRLIIDVPDGKLQNFTVIYPGDFLTRLASSGFENGSFLSSMSCMTGQLERIAQLPHVRSVCTIVPLSAGKKQHKDVAHELRDYTPAKVSLIFRE